MFNPIQAALWPARIALAIVAARSIPAEEFETETVALEDHEYPDQINYEADDFEEWLELQGVDRTNLAALRALKKLGWHPEDAYEVVGDLSVFMESLDAEALQVFGEAVQDEFRLMYVTDTLEGLVRRGYATTGLLENGEYGYFMTPEGDALVES